jgi:hypothetical protein
LFEVDRDRQFIVNNQLSLWLCHLHSLHLLFLQHALMLDGARLG